MGTDKATWPAGAPEAIKNWLSNLYTLLDSHDEDVPQRVAALYTPDATVWGMAGKSVGSAEIMAARHKSWDHMSSRTHSVLHVYTANLSFTDIILVGRLDATFKNGRSGSEEFVVRIVFDEGTQGGELKGKLYKVWGDSAPWMKIMKGE